MPTQISDAASVTFEYESGKGYAASNVTEITFAETISLSGDFLTDFYHAGKSITHIISISNNSDYSAKNIKITDNMGTYSSELGKNFTPLTYEKNAYLYIGGVFHSRIKPEIYTDKTVFSVLSIPPKSNALIIHSALVNPAAPPGTDGVITDTINVSSDESPVLQTYSCTVQSLPRADIKIIKHASPKTVLPGEKISYTFFIYNYGNTQAKNVVLKDNLPPELTAIRVTVGETPLPCSDYSVINQNFTLPSYGSGYILTVPEASFCQDNTSGEFIITPGSVTVCVTGQM